MEKEERLERVRQRLKEWEAKQAVKSILDDILVAVARNRLVMEIRQILEEVTVKAIKEGKSRKLFSEMVEFGLLEEIKRKIAENEMERWDLESPPGDERSLGGC